VANSVLHAFPKVVSRIPRFGRYLTVHDTWSSKSDNDTGNEFPANERTHVHEDHDGSVILSLTGNDVGAMKKSYKTS
jgi:hypothetical protein